MKRSELKGILAGMILGDGTISIQKDCKNAHMRLRHSIKQEEYLKCKVRLLEELTKVYVMYSTPTIYPQICCKTAVHPLYTRLREIAYPNGKKEVTSVLLDWLTPQGIAIWYMDDGSLIKRKNYNKSGRYRIHNRQMFLNTCSFSLKEHELMVDFFKKRYGVTFKIKKDGKYYRLRCGAIEANKFFEIVKPYIIESMAYKIDMQYDK